ncbi:MAG: AMP-binding protein [Muribaculaceae bacterium]|nr:AMP-binding protein [Muribaculaceae bacterium]
MSKEKKPHFSVEITDTDQFFKNIPDSLNEILEASVRRNWELPALSDFKGDTHTYGEVASMIEKLHILFKAAGVEPGDKIAICGKNSAKWAIAFIACLTSGAVAVPILHEFKPETIHHLVNHSDAKLLFIDEAIWKHLDNLDLPTLKGVLFISELGMPLSRSENLTIARENIEQFFNDKYPHGFSANDIHWFHDTPDELAVINYTSGSTGMSKGVMLPYRSIWSNIKFCMEFLTFLKPGDGVLNMLPLAHLYGMVIEMLHPFAKGCHCTFLGRTPSPAVLLTAFAEIQPKLIITVPLVLEKIVKTKVFPVIEQPRMKFLLKLPIIKGIILRKIREQLEKALGGRVKQVIIGGAALNADVNAFLTKIKFPVTVGYGMTECGPLITYETPDKEKPGTVGKIVERMEAKIDSPDPEIVPGNLWVRGDNVMKGYYKNDEATKEVMRDGWMNTGDLVTCDKDGNIRIMGRSKTMILGPSGQNIYPEEIEQKINNLPYVVESVVIDDHGKLVGLIFPDFDSIKKDGKDIDSVMDGNLKTLNPQLPGYSKISEFRIFDKEFEKTPKRSIKRFLYQPSE